MHIFIYIYIYIYISTESAEVFDKHVNRDLQKRLIYMKKTKYIYIYI